MDRDRHDDHEDEATISPHTPSSLFPPSVTQGQRMLKIFK